MNIPHSKHSSTQLKLIVKTGEENEERFSGRILRRREGKGRRGRELLLIKLLRNYENFSKSKKYSLDRKQVSVVIIIPNCKKMLQTTLGNIRNINSKLICTTKLMLRANIQM